MQQLTTKFQGRFDQKMKMPLRYSKGITLVELMIASAILAMITALVVSLIFNASKNQSMITVQTNLKNGSEMALYRLGKEMAQAIKVFDQGAGIGATFRANLALDTTKYPSMSEVWLPTIRDQGVEAPTITCTTDPDHFFWGPSVGNSLFFAEMTSVVSFPSSVVATNKQRTINVYRFDYYYINEPASTDGTQPFLDYWHSTRVRKALRLIEWRSVLYADYDQLNDYLTSTDLDKNGTNLTLTAGEKTAVINTLANQGVTRAWKRDYATTATYYQAFYAISAGPTLTQKTSGYQIERAISENALRLTNTNQGIYSIAYNTKTTPQSDAYFFPIDNRVPYFFTKTPSPNCSTITPTPAPDPATMGTITTDNFPRGFEVMIIGPSTGRQVLVRITAVGKPQRDTLVEQTHMKTYFAKDL